MTTETTTATTPATKLAAPHVGINVHFSSTYTPTVFAPEIRPLPYFDDIHTLQLGPVSNFVTVPQLAQLRDTLTSYLAQLALAADATNQE